ncbi:MAG: DcaP family trimeric outer membrane transporter [Sphingobium sp.]
MNRHEKGLSNIRRWMLSGTAIVMAMAPIAADAKDSSQVELEARLKMLEQAVNDLKAELAQARAEQATAQEQTQQQVATQTQQAQAIETRVAAVEARPQAPAEGFRTGKTTFKMGGYIRTVAMFSRWDDGEVAGTSLGRDFYLPQTIPLGGKGSTNADFHAKQTRFWFDMNTDVGGHVLKGHIETDFQTTSGNERVVSGYDLRLRRAFVQYDNLTVGQDWSTFQNVAALPESTDFIGPSEGTVFIRQALIRYTQPLSKQLTLQVSAENPETASAVAGSPALIENDDDHLPDFVARLDYKAPFGGLSLAGMGRQLRVKDNGTGFEDSRTGWGVSAAGVIPLTASKLTDFRFMATYGKGIGRYLGVNFSPDAVVDPATGTLRGVSNFAAMAALKLGWTKSLRSTVMGGYQHVDYSGALGDALIAGYNKQAWSMAGNLFWSPAKGFDLGVEYRHGEREVMSGAKGQLDRFDFAAKYSF